MDAKKKTILAASLLFLWAGLAVWQWRLLQEPVRVPLMNDTKIIIEGIADKQPIN